MDESDFDAHELAEAEELLEGVDLARELPEDFPGEFPLPDDAWVIGNMSSAIDGNREIYISLSSAEDMETWVERYSSELGQHFTIESERISSSEAQARSLGGGLFTHVQGRWDFNGLGWDYGRLYLMDAQLVHADLNPEWLTENQIKQFEEAYGDATITMAIILRDH